MRTSLLVVFLACCAIVSSVFAQDTSKSKAASKSADTSKSAAQPASSPTTAATPTTSMTASLNKSLGVYVFPAKEQKPEQQAADEQACYSWAVTTGGAVLLPL